MPVRIGIVDSGLDLGLQAAADAQVRIASSAGGPCGLAMPPEPDTLGHGSAIARLVLARAPAVRLLSAQVFAAGQPTTAFAIAAAIDWCVDRGARIVNLSLGLLDDRAVLRESCRAASARGVLLVASRAARGAVTYPAAYPAVLAVSGDARCDEDDCSCMAPEDFFGASPRPFGDTPGGGASFAAARVSGLAAAFLDRHPAAEAADFFHHLRAIARFHGRERRQATG